jgi:hypothetical protein
VEDYAGAVIATFKGLSWAYGHGDVSMSQVEGGLQTILALFQEQDIFRGREAAINGGLKAALGCMAFVRGDWARAEELLAEILTPYDEPDSFLRWMLLVCALEQNKSGNAAGMAGSIAGDDGGRTTRSAYGAIRARYALFPEYWYRGARHISEIYAEQCIIVSHEGPFAGECRDILAAHLGISPGSDLLVRTEIEDIIRAAVAVNNPRILEELFPLMALPDNPYTIYALGAMQALASIPEFRNFFGERALQSHGRLAERLGFLFRS